MKRLSMLAVFICSLVYHSNCAAAAKVVSYPITRALPNYAQTSVASLSRRANTDEILTNNISLGAYYASVQVGTPAQTLTLLLGTGSSDVWVVDKLAATCSSSNCLTPFNPNTSQTISTVAAGGFDINYVDGSYAKGDYITDVFAVGQVGQARMILQMGLATNISAGMASTGGIMGIGYDGNEASSVPYKNFMDQMVRDQLTNTKLYSLWLNDLGSSTGSILFGGIDTEKYYGTLSSMPIHPDSNGNYTAFTVGLTSLSITPRPGSMISITNQSFSAPVVLESSTTAIWLPGYVVDLIYNAFSVHFVSNTPFVDCKYSNSSYMSFGFESGSVVNVAYYEIVNKIFNPSPLPNTLPFSDVCTMTIFNGDGNPYLLGDFFLRSAYVVFDLTNNRIGIAQSNLNSTSSNIVEVPAGAASIPQSTGVALPNPTTSSSAPTSTASTSTSTNSPATSPTISPTNSPTPNNNHAVAIGVGVSVPIVVILAALFGFYFWRRRRHQSPQIPPSPATVSELYTYGGAGARVKNHPAGAAGGMSPGSNISELASPHNSVSASSPREARSGIERKPVANNASELFVQEQQSERVPMSANLNDYHSEQRPMSSLMPGPSDYIPER